MFAPVAVVVATGPFVVKLLQLRNGGRGGPPPLVGSVLVVGPRTLPFG